MQLKRGLLCKIQDQFKCIGSSSYLLIRAVGRFGISWGGVGWEDDVIGSPKHFEGFFLYSNKKEQLETPWIFGCNGPVLFKTLRKILIKRQQSHQVEVLKCDTNQTKLVHKPTSIE